MNESGQDRRETLADIVAELRALSKCDEYSVQAKYAELQPTVCGKPILLYFAEIADRIEAAAKREKAETETDALAVGGIVEAERHTPGDAAAMREALKGLDEEMTFCERNVELGIGFALEGLREHCRIVRQILNAALSAPARNCDVQYADRVEMYGAFKDWCKAKDHTMEPMLAYDAFDWLLAPAAEKRKEKKRKELTMETNNVQKMREIIKGFADAFDGDGIVYGSEVDDLLQQARASLAKPPRNCDVGTPEEQTERMWDAYCRKYECIACEHGVERRCPLYRSGIDCRLAWAQMPYEAEEGGNNG